MNRSPIVCPFCPLNCDDLTVAANGQTDSDCPIAEQGFSFAMAAPPAPRIGSDPASPDDVHRLASTWFAKQDRVRIATASTPLSTSRTLATMVADSRIELFVDETPSQSALRTAVARDGNVSATLGDVKKHADLIWTIGDVSGQMPRLWQRLSRSPSSGDLTTDRSGPTPARLSHASMGANQFADIAFAIRSGSTPDASQADLIQSIQSAGYLAIILAPDAFDAGQELTTAEWIVKWTIQQNQKQESRSRRVVLVGMDAATTLRSVVGWHTNQRLTATMTNVDIRLGNAIAGAQPAKLQIGGVDPGPELAHAYVPAGIAGVHHPDAIIRGDATVTLPLDRCVETRPAELPNSIIQPSAQSMDSSFTGRTVRPDVFLKSLFAVKLA
ncbi:hypothetical protein K227x_17780 [Rubripirellula lacrimiformis]|uniref:Formyltransferase/hydrolase complex Fhc subunit B n=1 Tax=Rubripirellula lacrimiformis TaxID=1930273 RepID=A0A517N8D4_9BACT|nr:hypothetical protein [Rubripirellula lacrimiformis]QDT03396.1 hypothetical protein K227x_17780 [Rubripirellula lacrimiformis]